VWKGGGLYDQLCTPAYIYRASFQIVLIPNLLKCEVFYLKLGWKSFTAASALLDSARRTCTSIYVAVVGHTKTVIVLVGGCLFFGEAMPVERLNGICCALVGIIWFSALKLKVKCPTNWPYRLL